MTDQLQAPPTEVLFGFAKKTTLELEKWPLQSQMAVIQMMNTACQHRKLNLEEQLTEEQAKANAGAMDEARKAHAAAQVQREEDERIRAEKQAARAKDVATGGIALVDAHGNALAGPQAQPEAALVS
jgi:hypothetical protein